LQANDQVGRDVAEERGNTKHTKPTKKSTKTRIGALAIQ